MTKLYMMTVSREGIHLYGGRLEDKGSYTVFEDISKNSVEEFCALDIPESDRQVTQMGVIFSPAYGEPERQKMLGYLSSHGYANLKEYDFNTELCNCLSAFPHVLVLSSDADDLYAEYYDNSSKELLASKKMDGAGKDPRIDVLAECIWKKLMSEASYLNKEKDFDEVRKVAKAFLRSKKSELDDTIYLEGEEHDFFIRRRDAQIDNVLDHGSSSVLSNLSYFANENQINKQETLLVLSSGLTHNSYFHDVFNGFTPEIFEVDEKTYCTILTTCINKLAGLESMTAPLQEAGLPLAYIHEKRGETSIFFDIQFPEGAYAIEVTRDGTPIRTITDSQFTDSDLEPAHTYRYGFTVVYKNEFGDETHTRVTTKDISTTKIQFPTPVSLNIQQTDKDATVTWKRPERGIVRIYHSPHPFELHCNDLIEDVKSFDFPALSSLDTHYTLPKDFCGERYFLPVTIVENMGIAGEQQGITSMIAPKGVRVDSTDISSIKVIWLWDNVPMVRIKWSAEDGNESWEDIADEGQAPEFALPLTAKARNFTICVSALCKTSDGKTHESESVVLKVTLSPVKVNFQSAKSEAKWFSHKNEFSVTLQADGEPPCDLYVLLEEGSMPLNLTNFKSHCTIPHQDLADGKEKKFVFSYQRMQKKLPLYFRIIAADRGMPLKVVPETQRID